MQLPKPHGPWPLDGRQILKIRILPNTAYYCGGGALELTTLPCEYQLHECEVEPIPSYSDLQSSFGTIRRYMESCSCDVSKYVGLLVHIKKYLQVVHAYESHQRTIDSYLTRDL